MTTPNERPHVNLDELVIVVSIPGTIPVLINPDFLRYNEIIDPEWSVELPIIIESKYSQVNYTNGLSLVATEERLVISQTGQPSLTDENVVSPEVVNRYLKLVPPAVEYESVEINPTFSIRIADSDVGSLLSPLHELQVSLLHNEVKPDMQVRSLYAFDDKWIGFHVVEETGEDSNDIVAIRFVGRVHHQASGETLREQAESVECFLRNWQEDVDDFLDLTYKFYSKYSQKED